MLNWVVILLYKSSILSNNSQNQPPVYTTVLQNFSHTAGSHTYSLIVDHELALIFWISDFTFLVHAISALNYITPLHWKLTGIYLKNDFRDSRVSFATVA